MAVCRAYALAATAAVAPLTHSQLRHARREAAKEAKRNSLGQGTVSARSFGDKFDLVASFERFVDANRSERRDPAEALPDLDDAVKNDVRTTLEQAVRLKNLYKGNQVQMRNAAALAAMTPALLRQLGVTVPTDPASEAGASSGDVRPSKKNKPAPPKNVHPCAVTLRVGHIAVPAGPTLNAPNTPASACGLYFGCGEVV